MKEKASEPDLHCYLPLHSLKFPELLPVFDVSYVADFSVRQKQEHDKQHVNILIQNSHTSTVGIQLSLD